MGCRAGQQRIVVQIIAAHQPPHGERHDEMGNGQGKQIDHGRPGEILLVVPLR